MNNYSIFGPTIYIENSNSNSTSNSTSNQRQNSSPILPNINELFSNLFSTEFNDILQNPVNNIERENIQTRTTTDVSTDTTNIEEVVFLYEPVTQSSSNGLTFQEINENTSLEICTNHSSDENMCVICHQNIDNNAIIRKINQCSHFFHVHCIDQWFHSHNNCPTCRHVLVERTSRSNRPMYQFRYGRDS
jgi:hypothetical protein